MFTNGPLPCRPPRGSTLRIDRSVHDQLVVEWLPPSATRKAWERWGAILRLVLVSWAVLPICMVFAGAIVGMLRDPKFPQVPFLHWEFFAASVVGLIFIAGCALHAWIIHLPAIVLKPRPERIVLSGTNLQRRPGRFWADTEVCWGLGQRIARDAVHEVRLERSARGQQLLIDTGRRRREVGACLREPDRNWLHAVLCRWVSRDAFSSGPSADREHEPKAHELLVVAAGAERGVEASGRDRAMTPSWGSFRFRRASASAQFLWLGATSGLMASAFQAAAIAGFVWLWQHGGWWAVPFWGGCAAMLAVGAMGFSRISYDALLSLWGLVREDRPRVKRR